MSDRLADFGVRFSRYRAGIDDDDRCLVLIDDARSPAEQIRRDALALSPVHLAAERPDGN